MMDFEWNRILCDDVRRAIALLPDASVQLAITSPPYFETRLYGLGELEYGAEKSEGDYLWRLSCAFGDLRRVMKDGGILALNVGDIQRDNELRRLPQKLMRMLMEHHRWALHREVVWIKKNPTPKPGQPGLARAWEPFYVFVSPKPYVGKFCAGMYAPSVYNIEEWNPRPGRKPKVGSQKGFRYMRHILASEILTDAEKQAAKDALLDVIEEVREGRLADFRMKIRGCHKPAFGGLGGGRQEELDKKGYCIIRLHGRPIQPDYIIANVERAVAHPAPFPLAVVEPFVRTFSNPGDVVFDPFCGSGTALLAAKRLGRRWLGVDLNPEYCAMAQKRVEEYEV